MNNIRTLTAIERDGFDIRTLTVTFETESKDMDLMQAITDAVNDFVQTERGRKVFEYNCECFNLADVVNELPKEFCTKHGFKIMDSALSDEDIDWDHEFCTISISEEE